MNLVRYFPGASSSKRDRREIGNTAKDTEGGGRGGELGRNMSAEESGRSGIGFDPKEYSAHLMVIGALVKKNPAALLPELPRVAQAVVRYASSKSNLWCAFVCVCGGFICILCAAR